MLAGGLLSLLHAVVTIHLRADQVVSGLALTFLGTGLARVLGEGLSSAGETSLLPRLSIPLLVGHPGRRARSSSATRASSSTSATCSSRSPGSGSTGPGPGSTSGGRRGRPRPPTPRGSGVYRTRYAYVFVGGLLAGLAGATITLAVSPGWFSEQTTNGRGWIAIGLVIFAQWSPLRAAFGAYLFGAVSRFVLDVQGVDDDLRGDEPVPAGSLGDVLPRDAAVPARDRRRRARVAPGDAQADGRAGRARDARTSGASGASSRRSALVAGVEALELHLDEPAGVELELARRVWRAVAIVGRGHRARTR